jgi:hypothetical protein
MTLLNFSHPLTPADVATVERLTGQPLDVIDLKTQFAHERPFAEQVRALVDSIGYSAQAWQTMPIIVNPPAFAPIAAVLLAELHGRMGYFPPIIRLKPVPHSTPPRFEVAEIINLQAVRETARQRIFSITWGNPICQSHKIGMDNLPSREYTERMVEGFDFDLNGLQDLDQARECLIRLLNLVEEMAAENRTLRAELQHLRDENNRLKGEQGQPSIKPGRKPSSGNSADHSSERERRQPQAHKKGSKVDQITIDREEVLTVDRASLPPDAEFKGHEPVVVQDLRFQTDHVRFWKEKFYSATTRTTYLAKLPAGYEGEFGPGVRALALVFYFGCQMTEPKIGELFRHVGVTISAGQVSNLLIKGQTPFHTEKEAVYAAGLRSGPWQHLDDTATRVDGQNHHCHIVDNPLHTTFLTTPAKDRLTIIDVLCHGQPRRFRLNAEALGYLDRAGVSAVTRRKVAALLSEQDREEAAMRRWLDEHLPGLSRADAQMGAGCRGGGGLSRADRMAGGAVAGL